MLVAALGLAAYAALSLANTIRPHAAEYFAFTRVVEMRADIVREAAASSGLDANLLAAVMCKESSGRIGVRSSADALGLFQLRIETARERARARERACLRACVCVCV